MAADDRSKQMKMSPCPGRARHWRILPGTIGGRSPVCIYCGSPNPRPLTEDEWDEAIYMSYTYPSGSFAVLMQALDEHTPGWRELERARVEARDARMQYLLTHCKKCRKGLHNECEVRKCICEHTVTISEVE
jgi:hypothetical protein